MVWQWVKNVARAVFDAAKIAVPPMYIADRQERNIALTIASNTELAERREEMQLAQLKLQYIQGRERQDFQAEQARLNYERAAQQASLNHQRSKELSEFIQRAENARLEKSLDFQRWRLEQETALQWQLLKSNQEFQRELAIYQRQTSLKVLEDQKRLENSPIWLVASDILNSHSEDKLMPLRVFFAPPKLQFERFASAASAAKGFPEVELTLAEGLRQFLKNYSSQGRPIDFVAGAWVSKSYHSEASIKALFGVLKSEPTLILESEVDGDYLNFRVGYWSLNWSKYRYDSILSRLPYRDILYEAAKVRARRWPETKAKLIAAGENPEEVDNIYGQDNIQNLAILQKEERFRQAGITAQELKLNYIVNKEDFEELCEFLIVYHCLFAGLIADEYFLIENNLPPLLPLLLPSLLEKVPDNEVVQEMIKSVVYYYGNIYQFLATQRSTFVPKLSLDLAKSLAHLPDKAWAKGRIVYSMQAWLKLRGLAEQKGFELLIDAVESALTVADVAYVQQLNECLTAIGEQRCLSVMDACYKRGVERYKQGEYQLAIADFDQAIQLNPQWAEAYYQRGLTYNKLEQYQQTIEDYTKALQINPNWASVYCNRGNAYYKLGQHEQAIADYDLALSINPNFAEAERNRDIVQGVWDELKRKQEEKAKQDCLSSDVGVDYTQLRDFLRDGKWREADEETRKMMLKVSKREEEGWLREEDIEKFPCTDLRTINQLWVKYSNGRFGFSVQKRIWEEVGGTPEYNSETAREFSDRVGWRRNNEWITNYDDLTFTTQAPLGHLPGSTSWVATSCGSTSWSGFWGCHLLWGRQDL